MAWVTYRGRAFLTPLRAKMISLDKIPNRELAEVGVDDSHCTDLCRAYLEERFVFRQKV